MVVTNKIIRTCALHNWLKNTSTTYLAKDNIDHKDVDTGKIIQGSWRNENLTLLLSVEQSLIKKI